MELVLMAVPLVAGLVAYAAILYLFIERITRPKRRPLDWRQRRG
jgi:hypothetical protein